MLIASDHRVTVTAQQPAHTFPTARKASVEIAAASIMIYLKQFGFASTELAAATLTLHKIMVLFDIQSMLVKSSGSVQLTQSLTLCAVRL